MYKLILASQSPRRKSLLMDVGLSFEVRTIDTDETVRPREKGLPMVKRLSLQKGLSVLEHFPDLKTGKKLILSADTTVVDANGRILGKPQDTAEAIRMIQKLQGKTHFVFTGFTLIWVNQGQILRQVTRAVKTSVKFRKLTRDEIRAYVNTGESLDKAGAYGAQGKGMTLVESIRGSYTNVVGLPIAEVLQEMRRKK